MEAHLNEEFKLWSFVILCQSKSRMQEGKKEKSNMKFKMTETFGHILSTSWSLFHAYYISFRISGSQKSNASNGVRIGVETKKLWPFEDNCIKLCETTSKHMCATSQVETPSSQLRTTLQIHLQAVKQVVNHLQVAESPPSCEITNSTCKIKVQTCKMDNSTCESPCEIQLCNLRYLQPTRLDFFSRYFV